MGHTATDSLCWLLSRVNHAFATRMAAALEDVGIPPRHHQVLVAALAGEFTQIELARQVGLDKTTMVVTVDELEARGLAERRPSKTDRRARVIHVTAQGQKCVLKANDVAARVNEEVLSALGDRERKIFLESLETLAGDALSSPVACQAAPRRRSVRASSTA